MYRYGEDSLSCVASKRDNLFSEGNRDLALVARTWPELLPGVRDLLVVVVVTTTVVERARPNVVRGGGRYGVVVVSVNRRGGGGSRGSGGGLCWWLQMCGC